MGSFRHYWVAIKLMVMALATLALTLHMRPIGFMAQQAAIGELAGGAQPEIRYSSS